MIRNRILFSYPESAKLDRPLTKNKIKEHASMNSKLCLQFTQQIQQIIWKYKLAQNTVNIPPTQAIHEIQIFNIILKVPNFSCDLLRCIDLSIPSPIIFELHFENKTKVIAAYKRQNEGGSSIWSLSNYFETSWIPSDTQRQPLPIALDLEKLYVYLLNSLMPFTTHLNDGLADRIERTKLIISKQKELEKCKTRLHKEKQFNRKVTINAELRTLKQQLENLTGSLAESKV